MKPRILAPLFLLVLMANAVLAQDEPRHLELQSASDFSDEESALLKEAFKLAEKGEIETSRFIFNSIIEGYGKSSGAQIARLALADSYFFTGGSESLSRAETNYNEWLFFMQGEENADQVLYRISQIQMRMQPLEQDSLLHRVEQTLNTILERFPKTPLRPQVEDDLYKIHEKLADQNLAVAKFYYMNRGAMAAAEDRLKEILEKYQRYSKTDEVLLLLGKVESGRDDFEESGKSLRLLIEKYPKSKNARAACELLGSCGEMLPETRR